MKKTKNRYFVKTVSKEKSAKYFRIRNKPHRSINLSIRGLPVSATLRINEYCAKLKQDGYTLYKLGLGQSPFPVPPSVIEALKQNAHQKDYLPVRGLQALRDAVAEFHQREDKVDIEGNNVLIGPGSKELLFLLQLTFYGEIIVPSPCWVSYIPQAQIIGRNVKIIKTSYEDKWRLLPDRLESLLERDQDYSKPRVLILNYPGNPDGMTYSKAELSRLTDVASEYGLLILSDEIYGKLHHKGKHISIAKFYPEGTIISSGLSKWCGAGGWRLGTFSFPEELKWLMNAMASVASETYTSVSAPIQYAALTAFNGGPEIENYLQHSRRILRQLGTRCAALLEECGIRIHKPAGAFYLFPDFSPLKEHFSKIGIYDSTALSNQLLLDTGVAILPGEDFSRPSEELTARIAYVNFDGEKALEISQNTPIDAELSEEFLQKYCEDVLQAIHLIVDWTKEIINR